MRNGDGGGNQRELSRRQVLRFSGMAGVGTGITHVGGIRGFGTAHAKTDRHGMTESEFRHGVTESELPETATWMTDEVPEKPLHDICLPGTHHAAMHGCGGNYWWHCQTHDMVRQLEDGVRYFDIRVGAYYEKETLIAEGIAQQMSDEWVALFDEAGGPGSLIPDIPGVDGDIEDELNALLGLLLDEDDPEWVAEKYTESCLDAGSTPEGRELSLDALLLRVLAALFSFDFDVPDFGLDLSTIRLDESAGTDVQPDGFNAQHGGNQARPYDWGASLESEFNAVANHFDTLDGAGASELTIVELGQFWDLLNVTFDHERATAFTTMVEDAFGEYLLDMSDYSSSEFAALTPSAFDRPRIAVFISGLPGEKPEWAGPSSYLSSNWPNEAEPGAVFRHGVTHTETTSHSPTELDRVGFQVTPDADIVLQVTVEDILGSYDSRIQYTDLLEAAERTNLLLGGYAEAIKRNPEQNPNIISLDYYETSPLVSICRELSREEFINGESQIDDLPIPETDYRLVSVGEGCPLKTELSDGCVEPDDAGEFSLLATDDGSYRVETPDGVLAASGTENGAAITQESWDGSDRQRWFPVRLGDATSQFALINYESGQTLDIARDYDDIDDGSVSTWHLHGAGNQRWWLIPADGPPPVVDGAFPRDDDGDGLYEVVTGGEAFSIADVQTLFATLEEDDIQGHAEAYDFSGTNPGRVSIFDVQALFNRLS